MERLCGMPVVKLAGLPDDKVFVVNLPAYRYGYHVPARRVSAVEARAMERLARLLGLGEEEGGG